MDRSRTLGGAPPAQRMCGPVLLVSAFLFLLSDLGLAASDTPDASDHWNLFTPEHEARLGRELGEWVEAHASASEATGSQDTLSRVGKRLLVTAPLTPPQPGFRLLRAGEPYALGLPGGRIYLTTAMVVRFRDEADLAGALAHELAHVALRQTTRTLSRSHRFRIPAALVAADRGNATLLDALQAIDAGIVPGAPVLRYSPDDEREASEFAARLLALAGYPPESAAGFHRHLRLTSSGLSSRYLERHPGSGDIPSQGGGTVRTDVEEPSLSEDSFRQLVRKATRASAGAGQLDTLLAWSGPVAAPKPARTRERFINRSYVFDYPADWIPGKPGDDETIEVAPRGGRLQPAGQPARLVVGLLAGTLEPMPDDLTGSGTLSHHLADLRPGLRAGAPATGGATAVGGLQRQILAGISPTGGEERVWAFSRRLPERVFYLLLIAPAAEFPRYQTEFEAIAASVDLQGHPRPRRPDVQREGGASK